MQALCRFIGALPKPLRQRQGTQASELNMTDLAHFCSRMTNHQAIDTVLDAFDRFCIVGQECSLPYVAQRLAALGSRFIRAPSHNAAVIGGLAGQFDCLVICGPQGRYTLDKPAVALIAADPPQTTWNVADPLLANLIFVVPLYSAPSSGQGWFYPHPMERGEDDAVFQGLKAGLRNVAVAKRSRAARLHR